VPIFEKAAALVEQLGDRLELTDTLVGRQRATRLYGAGESAREVTGAVTTPVAEGCWATRSAWRA
jgi:hypothetical protein